MDTVLTELRVTVRYFAAAAEAAGRQEEYLGFAPGSTLGDLKHTLEERYGEPMARVLRSGSFLVDKVVRRDAGHPLSERVDVLPPFAGG
ncbi:MoaD/ThiS family protein [Homoserinimonas sp. A447]